MKLLFDENLSPRLVELLSDTYPGSLHVRDAGLQAASDDTVWRYAVDHELTIVSKDADFHQRSFLFGSPPKVIWIRRLNCTTTAIESILRANRDYVTVFQRDPSTSFMILD